MDKLSDKYRKQGHRIVQTHHPDQMSYQCHDCPFQTNVRSDMRKHTERHAVASFTCNVCNMPFRAKSHLTGHERQVHGIGKVDRAFVKHCALCPYTSLHTGDIARHRKKHIMADFHCKYCNYPFANEMIMDAHIRKNHAAEHTRIKPERNQWREKGGKTNETHKSKLYESYHEQMHRKKNFESRNEYTKSNRSKAQTIGSAKKKKSRDKKCTDRNTNMVENVWKDMQHNERKIKLNENDTLCVKTSNEHYREKHKKHKGSEFNVERRDKKKEQGVNDRTKKIPTHISNIQHNGKWERVSEEQSDSKRSSISHTSDTSLSSMEDVCIFLEADESSKDSLEVTAEFETMTVMLMDNTTVETMRCLKCIYFTTNKDAFNEHMEMHKCCLFPCQHCKMPFLRPEDLEKHMEDKHESDSDEDRKNSSTDSLNEAEEMDVSEMGGEKESNDDLNEIKCAFCDFKTNSYFKLKYHIDGHLENEFVTVERTGDRRVHFRETIGDEKGETGEIKTQQNEDESEGKQENEKTDDCIYTATRIVTGDVTSIYQSDLSGAVDGTLESSDKITESHKIYTGNHTDGELEYDENNGVRLTEMTEMEANKLENRNSKTDSYTMRNSSLTGRLDKETFKKTKKLYAKVSDGTVVKYECLVCDRNNLFDTANSIWLHFKKHHKKLRRRLCSSCPYCSHPFPKKYE